VYVCNYLELAKTAFWDNRFGVMFLADLLANIALPFVLVPLSVMAVLHAKDPLDACLTAGSILWIPSKSTIPPSLVPSLAARFLFPDPCSLIPVP
jgi:hypothetical protein